MRAISAILFTFSTTDAILTCPCISSLFAFLQPDKHYMPVPLSNECRNCTGISQQYAVISARSSSEVYLSGAWYRVLVRLFTYCPVCALCLLVACLISLHNFLKCYWDKGTVTMGLTWCMFYSWISAVSYLLIQCIGSVLGIISSILINRTDVL